MSFNWARAPEITVSCPECKAKPMFKCVYLDNAGNRGPAAPGAEWGSYALYPRNDSRVGQPTKRPHATRTNKANAKAKRKEIDAWYRARLVSHPELPYIAALRAYDQMERDQMREWLRCNYTLFQLRKEEAS